MQNTQLGKYIGCLALFATILAAIVGIPADIGPASSYISDKFFRNEELEEIKRRLEKKAGTLETTRRELATALDTLEAQDVKLHKLEAKNQDLVQRMALCNQGNLQLGEQVDHHNRQIDQLQAQIDQAAGVERELNVQISANNRTIRNRDAEIKRKINSLAMKDGEIAHARDLQMETERQRKEAVHKAEEAGQELAETMEGVKALEQECRYVSSRAVKDRLDCDNKFEDNSMKAAFFEDYERRRVQFTEQVHGISNERVALSGILFYSNRLLSKYPTLILRASLDQKGLEKDLCYTFDCAVARFCRDDSFTADEPLEFQDCTIEEELSECPAHEKS